MRHIGRDENEVAGIGLGDIFEMLAPAHPRPPLDHVNDAFERAVVVRAGLGVGVDMDRAGPDLLRPDPGEIDRRGAVHAGGLRRVGVELIAGDHLDAVGLPVDPLWLMPIAHHACPENPLFRLDMVARWRFHEIVTPLSTGNTWPVTMRDSSL